MYIENAAFSIADGVLLIVSRNINFATSIEILVYYNYAMYSK
jgi:hypothetical protein